MACASSRRTVESHFSVYATPNRHEAKAPIVRLVMASVIVFVRHISARESRKVDGLRYRRRHVQTPD